MKVLTTIQIRSLPQNSQESQKQKIPYAQRNAKKQFPPLLIQKSQFSSVTYPICLLGSPGAVGASPNLFASLS